MGELLRPRWIAAHLTVLALAVLFVNLGFWQLDRHEERKLENTIGSSRYAAETLPLTQLVEAVGDDIDSLVYHRTTAEGVYQPEDEVLIRSQVYRGEAGFHVVTPLLMGESAVLVNRGWVPLVLDRVPVEQAPPPAGSTLAEGWLSTTEERGALGPEDPAEGRLVTMNRIDIERIQQQVAYPLEDVVLNLSSESELPIPVPAPEFEETGPHLAYAIQWFGFALVGLVGYFFLVRKTVRRSR